MTTRPRVAQLIAGPEKASSGDFAYAREEIDLLRKAGDVAGFDVTAVDWDRRDAEEGADAVLVGPCWDYQDRAASFLDRIDRCARRVPVWNAPTLIRWNADKHYLPDLERAGTPVPPTLWREDTSLRDLDEAFDALNTDRIVVKPRVGAGAMGLFTVERGRVTPGAVDPATLSGPHLIQPFLPAITSEGEYSFVFFDGVFSHALLKTPKAGDFRSQGEYGARERRLPDPAAPERQAAERALGAAPADDPPLYARVDMVRGVEGDLQVMELELIEPQLYFNVAPDGAVRLADAIARRL